MSKKSKKRVIVEDNDKFPRVNTRVTKEALIRLNAACAKREREEPRSCPQGLIISELILKHLPVARELPPAPVEEKKRPRRKPVKAIRRGRPPKKEPSAVPAVAAAS